MTRSDVGDARSADSVADACWRHIGVQGDRSCPKLLEAVHCRNCPVFSHGSRQLFEREPPSEYLEEWTRRLSELDRDEAGAVRSLLVFRVGAEWLAFDARSIVEVVEPRPIHRVPHRTDRILLGLANIRGELYLCVSLRELLDLEVVDGSVPSAPPSAAGPSQPLLVAEVEHYRWVFPVDEIDGVHRVLVSAFENLPHTVEKSSRFFSQAVFTCTRSFEDRGLRGHVQLPTVAGTDSDAAAPNWLATRRSGDARSVALLSETRLFQALQRTVR